jgi:spore coat protein A
MTRRITRRTALKLGLGAGALLGAPFGVRAGAAYLQLGTSSPPVKHFDVPLPIPSVLQPARRDATTDYYEVTQRLARVEILPGLATPVWSYDGRFPGPTVVAQRGRRVSIVQRNMLPEGTSVHLHGGVTPPESDGYPTDLVPAGGIKEYVYPNDQRAATLWYHDHAMGTTAKHVLYGLAGMYIVRDDAEDALRLPSGDQDVPLILQDREFNSDGTFFYHEHSPRNHFFIQGDTTLVNGAPWPRMEVAARRYRFRVLNASASRQYTLSLSTGEPLTMIASDAGLLAAPVRSPSIAINSAERVEIVVDFGGHPVGSRIVLHDGPDDVMRFDVVRSERDDSQVPAQLAAVERLSEGQAIRTRTFELRPIATLDYPPVDWTINGNLFDPNHVEASPELGSVEIWKFVSQGLGPIPIPITHPAHVHMVHFQVLDRNGRAPTPYEVGWKDTVAVNPYDTVRVIMRFAPYRGKYILHCHNLGHEDSAMMANFEVV